VGWRTSRSALLVLGIVTLSASAARGTVFVVTKTIDTADGPCSLSDGEAHLMA